MSTGPRMKSAFWAASQPGYARKSASNVTHTAATAASTAAPATAPALTVESTARLYAGQPRGVPGGWMSQAARGTPLWQGAVLLAAIAASSAAVWGTLSAGLLT